MAVRRESVVLSLQDDFTTPMARAAAAAALLSKQLDTLDGSGRRGSAGMGQTTRSVETLGTSADRSGNSIDRLSGRISLLAQVSAALGPALLPIGAVALPAVAGLASQLGFAALGAGVFVGAMQGVGEALEAMNKAHLEPTKANLEAARVAMAKISPEAREFVKQLREMGPELKALRDAGAENLLPGVAEGLEDIERLLPKAERIMAAVAGELGDIAADAGESLAGQRWAEFFTFLETDAPSALSDLARVVGHVSHAAAEMWMAFDPLNDDFSRWLVATTRDLDDWAAGLDQTEGFAAFVDYVRTNGPQVEETLGAIANAAVQIVQAASPLGGPVLQGLEAVADVTASIADSDLGTPIFTALAALAIYKRALGGVALLQGAVFGSSAATGLKGFAGAAGALGSTASRGVQPVFVTNPGFGAGGGLPGKAGTAAGVAGGAAGTKAASSAGKLSGALGKIASNPLMKKAGWAGLILSAASAGDTFLDADRKSVGFIDALQDLTGETSTTGRRLEQISDAMGGTAKSSRDVTDALHAAARGADNGNAAWGAAYGALSRITPQMGKYAAVLRTVPKHIRSYVSTPGAVTSQKEMAVLAQRFKLTPKQVRTIMLLQGFSRTQAEIAAAGASYRRLPKQVKTAISTPGAIKSEADVNRLQKRYNLTPKQKNTVMRVSGVDAAIAKTRALQLAIANVRSKEVTLHVRRTGSAGVPLHKAVADGGPIYATEPGETRGSRDDTIPALLSHREWVQPVAAVDHYGERFMEDVRTRRLPVPEGYADGGLVALQGFAGGGQARRRGGNDDGPGRGNAALRRELERLRAAVAGNVTAINREKSARESLASKRSDLAGTVTGAFRSDLFGESNVWAAGGGAGNAVGILKADIAKANAFKSVLYGLSKQGLDGDALAAVASTGDVAKAQGLLSLGKAGVGQFESLYNQRTSASAGVGSYAGVAAFGALQATANEHLATLTQQNKALTRQVAALTKEMRTHPERTGRSVGKGINGAASKARRATSRR